MNIIELEEQAGLNHWTCEYYGEELKAFAELVRADERTLPLSTLAHHHRIRTHEKIKKPRNT